MIVTACRKETHPLEELSMDALAQKIGDVDSISPVSQRSNSNGQGIEQV